jgi:hypothetical protein
MLTIQPRNLYTNAPTSKKILTRGVSVAVSTTLSLSKTLSKADLFQKQKRTFSL